MAAVLGWEFTVACLGVLALLLWAIAAHIAGFAAVAVGICALVAIRAHDVGQNPPVVDEYRTEWDAFWAGDQWTPEQRAALQAQDASPIRFNRINDPDLGPVHVPVMAACVCQRHGINWCSCMTTQGGGIFQAYDPAAWEAEQIEEGISGPRVDPSIQ